MNWTKELIHFLDAYPEHKVVMRKAVCPCCNGRGSTTFGWHSDDAAVFTQEDFDEDPDLRENLMGRSYDKVCPECKGDNVVDVLDEDRCSPDLLEDWSGWQGDAIESEAVMRAERAMGA